MKLLLPSLLLVLTACTTPSVVPAYTPLDERPCDNHPVPVTPGLLAREAQLRAD